MTSRRKTSPVEVIDICDYNDDDNLATATAGTTRATATSGRTNHDGSSNDDDRKPAARASSRLGRGSRSSLSPVRKRALSSSLHQAATSTKKKKVKTEKYGATNNTKASTRILKEENDEMGHKVVEVVDVDALDVDDGPGRMEEQDDDEVEVVTAAASCIICPPAAAAAASVSNSSTTDNNDDDLQVVGTIGTMRLPHSREDCTEKTFQPASNALTATVTSSRNASIWNRQCCDLCYCK
jgi:hypothetical protein